MQIVLIGIQGSGKGELIKNLSKIKDFTYVSVGLNAVPQESKAAVWEYHR